MFKKYLIIASKQDLAGMNIVSQLSQFGQYDVYLVEGNIVYDLVMINLNLKIMILLFLPQNISQQKEKNPFLFTHLETGEEMIMVVKRGKFAPLLLNS